MELGSNKEMGERLDQVETWDGREYETRRDGYLDALSGYMHLDLYEQGTHVLFGGFEYAEASGYEGIQAILDQVGLQADNVVISEHAMKRIEDQKDHHPYLGATMMSRLIRELEDLPFADGVHHIDLLYRSDDYGKPMSKEAWHKVFDPLIEEFGYKKDTTNYLGEDTYYRIVK